jgi:hypothetical protein
MGKHKVVSDFCHRIEKPPPIVIVCYTLKMAAVELALLNFKLLAGTKLISAKGSVPIFETTNQLPRAVTWR